MPGQPLNADAVAFDCDGVLVDSSRSYDEAIIRVTDSLTRRFVGAVLPWRAIGPRLIERLRMTGGFNNDWDTTYALTIFAAMAVRGGVRRGRSPAVNGTVSELRRLVEATRRLGRPVGVGAVEAVLSGSSGDQRTDVAKLKAELGYPGGPPGSVLAATFDQAYYGGDIYREIYGADPVFNGGRGLIENEEVLVHPQTLRSLGTLFSWRMALVTGRTLVATEHTLGGQMHFFDLGASTFVGDAFRGQTLRRGRSRYSKPSPLGLTKAMNHLKAGRLLYVGDSGEDALMAVRARKAGRKVAFAAVCGKDESKRAFFAEHGADLILKSVNELPAVLGLGGKGARLPAQV